MPEPAIAVVIPTFNRSALLERVLAALASQERIAPDAMTVIIVDDGSTDDTADVVARFPGVVYLRQENAGPAAARNRGWAHAAAGIVAFTDDDTVPSSTWLADLSEAFTANPRLDAVGGVVAPLRVTFLTRFVQAEQHASHGVGPGGEIKYLVTANCAYRREVLATLGGFDESFPSASGEDTDLTLRAQAAGYRMCLVDRALVLHDHPDHLIPILRTYVKHGRSRRLVIARNPAGGWGEGRHEILKFDHWRRRYGRYRAGGLRPLAALAALGLRVVGLVAYAAGVAHASRRPIAGPSGKQTRVVVACPGADHVARGYERVSRELVTLLGSDPTLRVSLVKGSGPTTPGVVLPSLRRDRPAAQWISRVSSARTARGAAPRRTGRSWASSLVRLARRELSVTPYDIEALTFGLSLLGHTVRRRPEVLVLQDVPTARVVALGRRLPGWRTRILFVNGTPWPAPYPFADVVQHVTPVTWDEDPALRWEKVLLPLGTDPLPSVLPAGSADMRRRFGLPPDGPVVVSLGTMLDSHKRHLHLIAELAQLPEPRPFLVIAGAPDVDQDRIETAARALLGDGQRVTHVDPDQVPELLSCADVFVLPTVAHDGRVQRWVLGDFGEYVDMTAPGELARRLDEVLRRYDRWSQAEARRRYVDERFSWRALRDDYLALVHGAEGEVR